MKRGTGRKRRLRNRNWSLNPVVGDCVITSNLGAFSWKTKALGAQRLQGEGEARVPYTSELQELADRPENPGSVSPQIIEQEDAPVGEPGLAPSHGGPGRGGNGRQPATGGRSPLRT
jgi:hypothetical protein